MCAIAGLRKAPGVILTLAVLLLAPMACQPPSPTTPPATTSPTSEQPHTLALLDALQILFDQVIPPSSSSSRVAAYMPSEPLGPGTIVTSEDGSRYPITDAPWFAFVDDAPRAFFAHPCRYVFIDAVDGELQVVAESWPPEIDGAPMWGNRAAAWHLVEVLSIHDIPLPGSAFVSNAPRGDYGDAPDGTQAYSGVAGQFPTRYATPNGYQRQPGCHTLQTGGETLGTAVSAEVDAMDPNDPDGVPNLVDADSDERAYVILDGLESRLAFTVSVAASAPDTTRHLNVLIDFDQSGNWATGTSGPEWPVTNLALHLKPGSSTTVITPAFAWGTSSARMSPVWMRALLTRQTVDASRYSPAAGWDGSGQFEQGEVEDYFVFLMENPPAPAETRWPPAPGLPPGGGDGGGGGGGPPPAPGPEKGPCGYDVKYHVLIINCGDNARDLSRGTPIVGASCDAVRGAAQDQGYTSAGNLSPGGGGDSKTTLANIGKAFAALKDNVKCGDHVLIYICGHGRKNGGIAIKSPSGQTQEVMRPTDNGKANDGKDNSLKDFLDKIPACPDQDCEKAGCCCNVTVVIESCFAGNFDVDGVKGEGRTVIGTSTDTEAWATSGGGNYTRGMVEGMRDQDTDTDDPPNGVDPTEAHENGEEAVSEGNKERGGKPQEPWAKGRECECRCPCEPDIDVDKWVWNEATDRWVDQVKAAPGNVVRFRVEIENTGECRDLVDLEMIDNMAGCLEYAGDARLDFDGDEGAWEPDRIWQSGGGTVLFWDLSDLPPLSPGEVIGIEYDAEATETGPNANKATAGGHCSVDYSTVVSSADLAVVMVYDGEPAPPPEDVLEVLLEVEAESTIGPGGCSSVVHIQMSAHDLSGGEYPVTGVALTVNGIPWYNSGPVSTPFYSKTLQMEADCGQLFDFGLTAVNSEDVHASTVEHIVTPLP